MKDLLSKITYNQHITEERYYHNVAKIAFFFMELDPLSEIPGTTGRSDILISFSDNLKAIVEIKYYKPEENDKDEDMERRLGEGLDNALKAIVETDYVGPVRKPGRVIMGMGLSFYGRMVVKAGFIDDL
jgi:hypothetical protein